MSPNFNVLSDQSLGISDLFMKETQLEQEGVDVNRLNQKSSHNIKVIQELFTDERSVQQLVVHPPARTQQPSPLALGKVLRVQPQKPKPFKKSIEDQRKNLMKPDISFLDNESLSSRHSSDDSKSIKKVAENPVHKSKSIAELLQDMPRNASQRLLQEQQNKLAMRLNGMADLKFEQLNRSNKMSIGESKQFKFDRDYRSATTRRRMSQVAHEFIIGGTIMRTTNASKVSHDSASLKKQATADDQRYLYSSKYLGGSAIYPKFSAEERAKSIIEDDSFFAKEKLRLREKIQSTWVEVKNLTEHYLHDPKINNRATLENRPEPRGSGYRVGESLV